MRGCVIEIQGSCVRHTYRVDGKIFTLGKLFFFLLSKRLQSLFDHQNLSGCDSCRCCQNDKESSIFAVKMKISIFLLILCSVELGWSKKDAKKCDRKPKFLFGRVPPGQFEYSELNGEYSPKEAARVCEANLACGGFTFKGPPNSPKKEFEMFFFHYVRPEVFEKRFSEEQSFHWSSYVVQGSML